MIGSQRSSDEPKPERQNRQNRKNRNRSGKRGKKKCKKQRYRDYFIEEHGCRSKKPYKMAKCVGPADEPDSCVPTRIKTRKIKFVCPDGTSPKKEVEMVRKCGRKKNKWGQREEKSRKISILTTTKNQNLFSHKKNSRFFFLFPVFFSSSSNDTQITLFLCM